MMANSYIEVIFGMTKHNIIIKGTKDGLMFLLNDDCSYDEVIEELKEKLENSHQTILTGPVTRVIIKTGARKFTAFQEETIRNIFSTKGNLIIHSIEHDVVENKSNDCLDKIEIITGTIRSGQVQEYQGNVLYIGDINPGGILKAIGDIYVLGTIRGIVHAGMNGNKEAIIAASIMEPTQIRIADVISRPIEEEQPRSLKHEFAYVLDERIFIDKIQHLSKFKDKLPVSL